MRNYEDSLYKGDIIEYEYTASQDHLNGRIKRLRIKLNAILYKTKNGGFVDLDILNEESLFLSRRIKKADKVKLTDSDTIKLSNGIIVMPSLKISDVKSNTGLFVEEDSLVKYEISAKRPLCKRRYFK